MAETIRKQAEQIKLLKVCSEISVRLYSLFSFLAESGVYWGYAWWGSHGVLWLVRAKLNVDYEPIHILLNSHKIEGLSIVTAGAVARYVEKQKFPKSP